jgi:hypothetical protein
VCESKTPENVISTTSRATGGDFSDLRLCKTVVTAGEWQVALTPTRWGLVVGTILGTVRTDPSGHTNGVASLKFTVPQTIFPKFSEIRTLECCDWLLSSRLWLADLAANKVSQ